MCVCVGGGGGEGGQGGDAAGRLLNQLHVLSFVKNFVIAQGF